MVKWSSALVNDDINYNWIEKESIYKRFNPVEDFIRRSRDSFEEHLKNYLIDNLKRLGYRFTSPDHFLNFCTERISRVSREDNPNEFRFYLDYDAKTETGTYIGAYCDETGLKYEDNTVIATFGRQLK